MRLVNVRAYKIYNLGHFLEYNMVFIILLSIFIASDILIDLDGNGVVV